MVRLARIDDAPALDDVLAESFFEDPMTVHLIPDESRRRQRLRLGMGHVMRSIYLPNNGGWTTDELDGVALWAKRGDSKPSALQSLRDLPIHARSFGRHLPRAMSAFSCGEKWRPEQDHWYLDILGVRPDQQGHGVGSSLVKAGLVEIDKVNLPAFLISSDRRNLAFYERLGFVVEEEYEIGPVPVWPMLRTPSANGPRRGVRDRLREETST